MAAASYAVHCYRRDRRPGEQGIGLHPRSEDKIALPEHVLDLQTQHAMAQLDAQSKQLCAADDSDKSGHPLWSARAFLF
jgi:hypothetical protein